MRRLRWLIGLVVIVFLVGTLAALWSADPMDELRPYLIKGSVGYQELLDPSTGQVVTYMERHSVLMGISEEKVGRILQDFYSSSKGWTWSRVGAYLIEGKDRKGEFAYYGLSINDTISVTEKVVQTRKQMLWRQIRHRGTAF